MNKISFEEMLDDAYMQLDNEMRNQVLVLPTFDFETSTVRLHWKNVKEYLRTIRRNPDHFVNWMKQELPTKPINWFSGSKSDGLIIHGKFPNKSEVTDLAVKYVEHFVLCKSCKSPQTDMIKEDSKKYLFVCNSCGSNYYIS